MIKNVWILDLGPNPLKSEHFYFQHHTKEVVRFMGPWLRRYETYRALDAPADADGYGAVRGRLTELWFSDVGEWTEAKSRRSPFTPPPPGVYVDRHRAQVAMSVIPTEDFLLREPAPGKRQIVRWCQAIKYPHDVSPAAGDAWYLQHAEEVARLPGLLRFVSHRVLSEPPAPPSPWRRYSELWFDDFASWRRTTQSSAQLAPPPWGGAYPFVDMVSTFIGDAPEFDLLRDRPQIP